MYFGSNCVMSCEIARKDGIGGGRRVCGTFICIWIDGWMGGWSGLVGSGFSCGCCVALLVGVICYYYYYHVPVRCERVSYSLFTRSLWAGLVC